MRRSCPVESFCKCERLTQSICGEDVSVDEGDVNGKIFYVGKGTGTRSGSKDRDTNWHKYVNERSGGKHTVQIVS